MDKTNESRLKTEPFGGKNYDKQKNNPKVTLVDFEEKMPLNKAANFLETVATKLKEEGTFTLTHGEKTYEVTPSSNVEFEVKLEKRGNKHELEFELEWVEGEENPGLEIN